MRGIKCILIEQKDLAYGTSARFHGLLHSGGRYAVKDTTAAIECIEENTILRRIGKHCVEGTEGFFVRLPEDSAAFEQKWVDSCLKAGINAEKIDLDEAFRLEPNLSKNICSAYRVPDAAIDGFRLVWQNVKAAEKYGAEYLTYTKLVGIEQNNNQVTGITVQNQLTGVKEQILCDFIINAAGSWVNEVTSLADINVNVKPDRGTLIAFNQRITSRVINRLHVPSDADILVPHGSISILGTTSIPTDRPDDFTSSKEEVLAQLQVGAKVIDRIENYRILRVFAGTRPLYSPGEGRNASRNFTTIDHEELHNLKGLLTVVGGKLTTYRLMAEKTVDVVCKKLGINVACETANIPLVEEPSMAVLNKFNEFMPAHSKRAVDRLGDRVEEVVKLVEEDSTKKQLICECEMVTIAEVESVVKDKDAFILDDIRRKTRLGMGTCQGAFCALRAVGTVSEHNLEKGQTTKNLLTDFLESRWSGVKHVLWGQQLRETELMRSVYSAALNIDGAMPYEKK